MGRRIVLSTPDAIAAARRRQMARLVQIGFTLETVGQRYGLTRERVRQIIKPEVGAVRSFRPRLSDPPPVDREGRQVRRFWVRVRPDPSGCWLWIGAKYPTGYGSYGNGKYAHRAAYEMVREPIPKGLTIDHLCRVRHCVNPAHLEVVTQRENTLRSPTAVAAVNARKTHCKNGHEFTAENTRQTVAPNGQRRRECRTCKNKWSRIGQRRRYWARKAAAA